VNKIFDIATYAFIVGGILVLTRPGSQGPGFVLALGNSFAHVVQAATGQAPQTIAKAGKK
jgi:hypothetical protein